MSTGGSPITGYQVTRDNFATSVSVTSYGHTFTGLTNGTLYTFRVRAVNVIGNSPAAEITETPIADNIVNITGSTVAQIKMDIENVLESDDVIVIGTVSGLSTQLSLVIPIDRTVYWHASYTTNLPGNFGIQISGAGTLKITEGLLKQEANQILLFIGGDVNFIMTGGIIESSNTALFLSGNSTAVISGGTIKTFNESTRAIGAAGLNGKLAIIGGVVQNGGGQPVVTLSTSETHILYIAGNGGGIIDGGVTTTGTLGNRAYYTGDHAAKFRMTPLSNGFTTDVNLFNSVPPSWNTELNIWE
jgi:hypothetical protein